jgi:hypothetical protein
MELFFEFHTDNLTHLTDSGKGRFPDFAKFSRLEEEPRFAPRAKLLS